jgi:hypothetical protein
MRQSPVPGSQKVLKLPGYQAFRPVEHGEGLPVVLHRAKNALARQGADHVDPQGGAQLVVHLAQHLVGLDHLHPVRVVPSTARRRRVRAETWTPVTKVAPKSTQTRSGWRWFNVAASLSREVMMPPERNGMGEEGKYTCAIRC